MVKHVAAIFRKPLPETSLFNDRTDAHQRFCTIVLADLSSGGSRGEYVVFDTHTSILEGNIGAIPRRDMVLAEQGADARGVLEQAYFHDAKDVTIDAKEKSNMVYWLPDPVKS